MLNGLCITLMTRVQDRLHLSLSRCLRKIKARTLLYNAFVVCLFILLSQWNLNRHEKKEGKSAKGRRVVSRYCAQIPFFLSLVWLAVAYSFYAESDRHQVTKSGWTRQGHDLAGSLLLPGDPAMHWLQNSEEYSRVCPRLTPLMFRLAASYIQIGDPALHWSQNFEECSHVCPWLTTSRPQLGHAYLPAKVWERL